MTSIHTTHAQTARQQWARGLMVFGAIMLTIVGVLDVFRGVMGIVHDDVFVATRNYTFQFDLTGWGWVHVALGAAAVVVGIGLLLKAAMWARVCGVAIAGFVLISNFLSVPYYPLWSIVMMALSAFIVWALCVAPRGDTFDSESGASRTP
ncbi:membrane protein [Streptomyces hygroscopicus]|uniref:DUF7144 family membrane protein n=1 Tax=Streptomyces hygroscopicus TaxID=1912 RepID=UPI00223FD157|nr:hypothetical protein [Streptomyces hygroscopicus]MCW7942645.1 membrane protein [Streptomyces hygroscopicus]